MKIITWKNLTRLSVGFVLMSLVCLLVTTVFIQRQAYQQILSANARDDSTQLPYRQEELTFHPGKNIRFLQNMQKTVSLEKFQTSVFATSDSGLLQFSETGKLIKHFTVLDGLPESDLISLAVFQKRLFIGTRSNGLLSFDGKKFTRFVFPQYDTQAITALKAEPRELLIGTFNGGLISFDGEKFTEISGTKKEKRILKINHLTKIGEQLFIGTFDNGMWLLNGEIDRRNFTKSEGLLSNHIVGITKIGQELFVGTDLGISKTNITELAQFNESGKKKFQTHKVLPGLAGLSSTDEKLIAAKANGEFFLFEPHRQNSDQRLLWQNSGNLTETSLLQTNDKIFLTSDQGIFRLDSKNKYAPSLSKFSEILADDLPADNRISAITFDNNKNLWLGTLYNGIDVFNASGKKLKHIETEQIRDINFLQKTENAIAVATSQGLFQIDKNFQVSALATSEDLPGKSVMHLSDNSNNSIAIATNHGFYVEENGQTRGYSTVQGLPSNNIYTTLQTGGTTYVGTLGGLAKIESGKVVRVYKDSNSELTTNWVTALSEANGRIFIGTYGGGVFELLKSGDIRKFSAETDDFFVNPNAIFDDGERLYFGTLKGVRVLDLKTDKWSHIEGVFPSETVLSVTGTDEKIYFGTTAGVAIISPKFFKQ